MNQPRLAIAGATGLVGREFIRILEQRCFPMSSIKLLASARSKGKRLSINGGEINVQELLEDSFEDVDIALFSAGSGVSKRFSPIAAQSGAVVIDNSKAFRMDDDVPLIVPEVNAEDVWCHNGIIANPNCSTIQMVVALNPIHKINPIKRIIVDTYQSVSGTGADGIAELEEQTRGWMNKQGSKNKAFPHSIAFNVIPEIDVPLDNGYFNEEMKLVRETQKILHAPDLAISATAVRVPVFIGHSEAVHIELTEPMSPREVREVLKSAPSVVVLDGPSRSEYPLPKDSAGTDEVFVGRIRKDLSHPNGIAMWVVADNVRKGAALNAVQIAELLLAGRPSPRAGGYRVATAPKT